VPAPANAAAVGEIGRLHDLGHSEALEAARTKRARRFPEHALVLGRSFLAALRSALDNRLAGRWR